MFGRRTHARKSQHYTAYNQNTANATNPLAASRLSGLCRPVKRGTVGAFRHRYRLSGRCTSSTVAHSPPPGFCSFVITSPCGLPTSRYQFAITYADLSRPNRLRPPLHIHSDASSPRRATWFIKCRGRCHTAAVPQSRSMLRSCFASCLTSAGFASVKSDSSRRSFESVSSVFCCGHGSSKLRGKHL
jgi:hypothetical protein